MIDFLKRKSHNILFLLLLLIFSSFSNAQNEENNLNPKIAAGIGFQFPPLIGKKANVNMGMSSQIFITIPLTYTRKINLIYKFIYWEGNSTITIDKFSGWGTSISFMYSIINNPKFKLNSYFGPYSLNTLIPISFSAFNLGIQFEYCLINNINFGVDINQLLAFLQENVNPYSGRYFPMIITFNISYQF